MSPFTPIGEVSRWKTLYGVLQKTPVGGIAPYEELGAALGLDPVADRHTIQVAIRRAAQELEETDKRAVEPVTNVGYRVVEVTERLRLARQHQRKAVRALSRGKSKLAKFPVTDPQIVNLAGSSGTSREMLYMLMVNHVNSGKRTRHLKPRVIDYIDLGEDECAADEDES
jgi:hypothetical protein